MNTLLASKSVLLRLEAGSQGAKYLSAICPIPRIPTFVVILNGQLKEYLTTGTSKDEFIKRLQLVLRKEDSEASQSSPGDQDTGRTDRSLDSEGNIGHEQAAQNGGDDTPSEEQRSQVVNDLLEERKLLMEAKKKKEEEVAKADRAAKAKSRREELEKAKASGSRNNEEISYAVLQKNRQQEAREERARILKRVEDDKAERRARGMFRKEHGQVTTDSPELHQEFITRSDRQSRATTDTECALQIRLFDGATIRSKFPSQNTLRKDVRPWVDQQGIKSDIPYTFRQILTPQPNRTISVSEEEQSLISLGFYPSATLVLIPVKEYTSAYENDATSFISRGFSAGYGLVTAGVGLLSSSLTSIVGSSSIQQQEVHESRNILSGTNPPGTVRTLSDHDAPTEDQQFYNGNALNFEPGRKEEEKED